MPTENFLASSRSRPSDGPAACSPVRQSVVARRARGRSIWPRHRRRTRPAASASWDPRLEPGSPLPYHATSSCATSCPVCYTPRTPRSMLPCKVYNSHTGFPAQLGRQETLVAPSYRLSNAWQSRDGVETVGTGKGVGGERRGQFASLLGFIDLLPFSLIRNDGIEDAQA